MSDVVVPETALPETALPAAVLFDMDGTLIDSEGLWFAAEVAVMAELGAAWTEADQEICLGGPLERVAAYMSAASGTSLTDAVIGQMLLERMEQLLHSNELLWRPGARELLTEAKETGLPTALVSASWSRLIETVRSRIDEELGRSAFDVVVAGDDVEESKPHPEPYLTAMRALGVTPDRSLALEDSPTGVESAVAAGCRVIAIPHLADIDNSGAARVETLQGWALADLWEHANLG